MGAEKIVIEFDIGGRRLRRAVSPLEYQSIRSMPLDMALGRLLRSCNTPAGAAALETALREGRLRLRVHPEEA